MADKRRLMCVDEFKKNLCHYCNTYMSEEPCEPNECWVHDVIAQTDTVDAVEVVHGRWREKILVGGFAEEWGYVCSECGCTVSDRSNLGVGRYASKNQRLNYCPNCGAKMDGDGDG